MDCIFICSLRRKDFSVRLNINGKFYCRVIVFRFPELSRIPRPGLGYDQDFGCISFFIQTGGNHVSFRNVTGWNLFLNKFLLYFPGVPV